jgi:hypothetical protein
MPLFDVLLQELLKMSLNKPKIKPRISIVARKAVIMRRPQDQQIYQKRF